MKNIFLLSLALLVSTWDRHVFGQTDEILDSLYITETEQKPGLAKVLHAEPLFVDLIRDLGARKGEREWNVATGLSDFGDYDRYTALVEYEWAPVNRLGLEVELPFSLYYRTTGQPNAPRNRLNSLKLAAQYTVWVSDRLNTSLAFGYLHEFELQEFNRYRTGKILDGNVINPFGVIAKRWGNNWHTMIYAGPQIITSQHHTGSIFNWQTNLNVHYMLKGTRNFVGVEANQSSFENRFDLTFRPQMRLSINEHMLLGIVTGVPIRRQNERMSTFIRLIYEPQDRRNHGSTE
jgi:hypothetical protein